jgi:hypothetical protein
MKLKVSLLALFVAGLIVSVSIAGPPPGKGKPPGKGTGNGNGATNGKKGSAPSSTSTTTTTASGKKVQVCHRKGGKGKPSYKLITISKNALKAHLRHGDVMPVNGQCPGSQGTTTTTTTVPTTTSTTASTTTTTTASTTTTTG